MTFLEDYEKVRSQQIIEEYFYNDRLPEGEYMATTKLENGIYVTCITRMDKPKLKWWQKLFDYF